MQRTLSILGVRVPQVVVKRSDYVSISSKLMQWVRRQGDGYPTIVE